MKIIFTGIFCFFICLSAFSQGGGISNIRVELDKVGSQIVITYDMFIKGNKYDKFKVDIYYSTDRGKTFSEEPLEYITSPNNELNVNGGVSNGTNKKVFWNYFVENADFDGKNLAFKIVAEKDYQAEENRIIGLGGPDKAIYSIVPGMGDYQVRSGKRYWIITAGVLGAMGGGIYSLSRSVATNNRYANGEGNDFLKKATTQKNIGLALITAAATVWVTDIVLVAIRGKQNQKAQETLKRKREEERSVKPK